MTKNQTNKTPSATKSAQKVLIVLDLLLSNFAHGFTNAELSKATGFSPSNITHYIGALENQGFAERIQETGRIRASHRLAQRAVAIMNSLDTAKNQVDESIKRISTTL